MIDIVHAITLSQQPNGEVNFSIRDFTITGPQKALQSLIVELLSSNSLTARQQNPFILTLRRNNIRNLAELANIYTKVVREILRNIDDVSRPDNERILSSRLVGFTSNSPDSGIIDIEVTSRAKDNFTYTFPVRIS